MKFKINDIVTTEFGVGKIVYVDNSALPYLVHIDGFDGHNGNLAGPAIQDNYNNWWFFEECLELVKRNDNKYEVGDLVRVVNDGYSFKKGEIYTIKKIFLSENLILIDNWGINLDNLEPVTHLTTKEFIKEVEKLGYDIEEEQGVELNITDGYFEISVYIKEKEYINLEYFGVVSNISPLLKLIIKYLETPIEFREEPKKYTLELPNTTIKARYFRFGLPHAKHSYKFGALPKSTTNSDIDYQAYFTQQEIDQLHNQELIKTLIKKEVKKGK